jgi:hypothetical protein
MPPNCLKYLNSSRLPYMTTSIACESQPLGIPFPPIAAIPDLPPDLKLFDVEHTNYGQYCNTARSV